MLRTSKLFSVRMLGFGFFWAWLFLVAVSPSPLFGQLTGPGGTPFELWELCFRLLALVVVGGVARQLATTRGVWVLAVLSAVFGIAGVAALGLAQNAGMVAAAALFVGVADTCMFVGWLSFFGYLRLGETALLITLSYAVGSSSCSRCTAWERAPCRRRRCCCRWPPRFRSCWLTARSRRPPTRRSRGRRAPTLPKCRCLRSSTGFTAPWRRSRRCSPCSRASWCDKVCRGRADRSCRRAAASSSRASWAPSSLSRGRRRVCTGCTGLRLWPWARASAAWACWAGKAGPRRAAWSCSVS